MSFSEEVDMDVLREFYNPHPRSLPGAVIPFPKEIKKVADDLNGKRLSLKEAVARLRAVRSGAIDVIAKDNYIRLTITDKDGRYVENIFPVIGYR